MAAETSGPENIVWQYTDELILVKRLAKVFVRARVVRKKHFFFGNAFFSEHVESTVESCWDPKPNPTFGILAEFFLHQRRCPIDDVT